MSYRSFQKLLTMLKPYLQVNEKQGSCRNPGLGYVSPELGLHCLLRYLAGRSHHDIRLLAGVAKSTFFAYTHRGIDAILKCPHLNIQFPTNDAGLKEIAMEFQNKSSFGVLDGCIGALDGWLCRINVPLDRDTSNISAYFSGHYQCYGINIQAVCDSHSRFTYISCRSPGGTGDSRAFYGTALSNFIQNIPCGFYLVGDSAYTLSSSLLVPYTGSDKNRKENDVFNFYLSQLRIKIEQAFGLLVNKCRIFKKPIELNLRRIPFLVECCFQLHNFCINEREKEWFICEIPNDLIGMHQASYEEYLDDLDAHVQQRAGGRLNVRAKVREAIKKQLQYAGRD
jgi:hypothetical protein